MANKWVPLSATEAQSIIGEGLHTGFRKGTNAPGSAKAWDAINAKDSGWSEALSFLVWGLDVMGLALCKKVDNDDKE